MLVDTTKAILNEFLESAQHGPKLVRLDPVNATTFLGPCAFNEYARVFGERITACWMSFGVADCLGQMAVVLAAEPNEPSLIVHSRCKHLISWFQNYRREERGGKFPDTPVGP